MISSDAITLAESILYFCRSSKLKISLAESCTGGLVAGAITSVAGASEVFERGFITYSNSAKIAMLGVKEETLLKHGAVSKETALEMAIGAIKYSSADIAASVTGIAGPSGGSSTKPVGLVYIAVAMKNGSYDIKKYIFSGNREQVRSSAVEATLTHILSKLKH
jgi:nicotinamide-nucleotide amidase